MAIPQFSGWAKTWHDDENTAKRLHAIRTFGRAMKARRHGRWRKGWDEAGGTEGMLRLLSLGSVREVKAVCLAIRASNRCAGKNPEKEQAVEELVKALLPHHYPSTDLRTGDKRPLQKYYGRMLRGCSSSFVQQVLDAQDDSNPLFQELNLQKMCNTHGEMLRARLTGYLTRGVPRISQHELGVTFSEFVFGWPRLPGNKDAWNSTQFALAMLHARVAGHCPADRWPRSLTEMQVLMSVYSRFKRKKHLGYKVPLIKLGFDLIQLEPAFKSTQGATVLMSEAAALWENDPSKQHEDLLSKGLRLGLRGHILSMIAIRWKVDPDRFENLFAQALSLGLGGSPKAIGDGYQELVDTEPFTELSSELRWRLLCLYCKHIPEDGIDIAASTDYSNLANQDWPFEVVDKLNRQHAILFLRHLYSVNPNFDFLRAPRGYTSIFAIRNFPSRRNFNVELLLTTYQQGDVDTQQKAREEVAQLRNLAAATRDEKDRALLAKAATHFAIATGNLDVYAETLTWQKRFIRDSFAIQCLFARDTLSTSEGLDMLSGIILPVAEGITLSAVAQRLLAADQILKSLNDTVLMAKAEPSNNPRNWVAFGSFFTEVYKKRVARAREIKLAARELELDMFHTIWVRIVDLVHNIGSDFMTQVENLILDLLDGLSSSSLVAACKTLLDFAGEWSRKSTQQTGHDRISATIKVLSYRAVIRLVSNHTPVLAQDLIQQAIIEDPAASSWHRRFLTLGYMQNLSAGAAKSMLLSFASAIGEKLQEQSYVKVGEGELPESAPSVSLIKVSTVKHLAQLLKNAEFIALDSAIEVLIELFKAGTHLDIRLATLDSLLSALNTVVSDPNEQWSSNPIVDKVITTLEILIPIAGNINERQPMSTSDWAEAKKHIEVPSISTDSYMTIPPLLEAILSIVVGGKSPNLECLKEDLFSRLVLPTVKQSQEQHRIWFSLFLAKHRPTMDADRLPTIPITPQVWFKLLAFYGDSVPSIVLNEYNEYVLLRLRMPSDIQELNKALESDTTLRNDPNVAHWLYIFGDTGEAFMSFRSDMAYHLLSLIFSPDGAVAEKNDLVDVVVSQASALLDDYERYADDWHQLVASLKPQRPQRLVYGYDSAQSKLHWITWHDMSRALSLKLLTLLEGKIASEEGFAFPSTFRLRLWDVVYPEPRSIEHDNGATLKLVTHLDSIISSFLESHEEDALLWATLAEDVYNTLIAVYQTKLEAVKTSTNFRLRIAMHVGDLNAGSQYVTPAVQLIKVAVALKFIDSISEPAIPPKPKTKALPPDQAVLGDLIKHLHAVMTCWMQGGAGASAGVRNMAMQWKGKNKTLWENICSWDST